MRSTKLLAVLAGTALLAACTQEELVKVENAPQKMQEVVGAKLVGTDVSMNVSMGQTSTRYGGGENKWEKEDIVGLGWILNGNTNPETIQDPNGDPAENHKLYANHKYNYDENASSWTTQGNLYEGWHFAYYPWAYAPQVAAKEFIVNPVQGTTDQLLRYSQRLFVSNRKFIAAEDVDTETNTLETQYELIPAVKAIRVKTKPDAESSFANVDEMKNLSLDYITFNTGNEAKKVFAKDKIVLNAAKIPEWIDKVGDVEWDITKNAENFYNSYDEIFTVSEYETTLTTSLIDEEGNRLYKVSDDTRIISFAVPAEAELKLDEVSIRIGVGGQDGSYFLINSDDKRNEAALKAFVEAYNKDGVMTEMNASDAAGKWALDLTFELYDDIFVTDFNHITDIEEWKTAVKMVDILGREEAIFCIDGTIVFSDTIPMPETCKLTVNRATKESGNRKLESFVLQDGEFYGWPETLTSNVYLTIAEDATLYDAHEFNNVRAIVNNGKMVVPSRETKKEGLTIGASRDYTLTNNGTIVLGKYAKAQRVDNTDGRIEVIYGSYIELRNEAEAGEIAYVVMPEDAETPSRIKDVVATTGNDFGHASVNILVFDKENVTEFNFTKPINGKENDNPYNDNSSSADEDVLKLDGVSLEINGVAVTSSSTEEIVTVKNVTMTGAEASLTNVNVAGNLTVTDGGDVEVTTIAGDVKTDGDVTADAIAGGLTLSGNGVVSVKSIGGDVNVAGGEINATVAIAGNVTAAEATIVARTIEGDVTVNGDNTSIEGNKIKGKVDVTADGEVTLNVKTIEKALTNDGVVVIEGEEDVVIPTINNNATLTANTTINVHNITLKKGVANTTVQEDPEEVIWYTGTYVQGGRTTGKILPKAVTPETETTVTVASPEELATAAIEDGATIALAAGEYVIPAEAKNKTVTFVGTGNPADVKVSVKSGLTFVNGADITFEGITIQSEPEGEGYTNGFAHLKHATFNNCVIDGTIGLYATCEFNGCTFNVEGNYYNVWTWGAGTAKFDECTFNSDGKALLVYANNPDNGTMHQTVNITNCIFNDNGDNTVNGKAAIEITSTYAGRTYDVKINNTAVNGFAQTVPGSSDFNADFGSVEGANIGSNVWGNKCQLSEEYLNVVVDGVDVY